MSSDRSPGTAPNACPVDPAHPTSATTREICLRPVYMEQYFSGSDPDLINKKSLSKLDKLLKQPTVVVPQGPATPSWSECIYTWYEEYVRPNLLFILILIVLIAFLIYRYKVKQWNDDAEADAEADTGADAGIPTHIPSPIPGPVPYVEQLYDTDEETTDVVLPNTVWNYTTPEGINHATGPRRNLDLMAETIFGDGGARDPAPYGNGYAPLDQW